LNEDYANRTYHAKHVRRIADVGTSWSWGRNQAWGTWWQSRGPWMSASNSGSVGKLGEILELGSLFSCIFMAIPYPRAQLGVCSKSPQSWYSVRQVYQYGHHRGDGPVSRDAILVQGNRRHHIPELASSQTHGLEVPGPKWFSTIRSHGISVGQSLFAKAAILLDLLR
jgi:hypothetical protein